MQSGPFEWKEAALGERVRVEFRDTPVTVSRRDETRIVKFSEIDEVYYYRMYLAPFLHSLHVETILKNHERIKFGASGYGAPSDFNAEECRKAVIVFLKELELDSPGVTIFDGVRSSTYSNILFIGIIVFAFLFTAYQGWREGIFENLLYGVGVYGIVAVIMSVVAFFQLRKLRKPEKISAKEAYDSLEMF